MPRKEPQPQLSCLFHRLSNVVMCLATTLSTVNNKPLNITYAGPRGRGSFSTSAPDLGPRAHFSTFAPGRAGF